MTDLTLYSDYGCPFAHRVLALVAQLGVDVAHELVPIGSQPTPEGATVLGLPMLEVGDGVLVLTESRAINEYLAERFDYGAAFPETLVDRSAHRHALALVDAYLAPAVLGTLSEFQAEKLAGSLAAFERAMTEGPQPSLFALHIAPSWRWLSRIRGSRNRAVRLIETRPALRDWLERVLEHPSLASTTPDDRRILSEVAEAREDGRLPAVS